MKKYPIGFNVSMPENKSDMCEVTNECVNTARKSLVRIYFPTRDMTLSYYNDLFDLHCGDMVYVDGKLEGLKGQVVELNYTFKIKLSDYHKVIAVADTKVKGDLYIANAHLIAFDENTIPYEKVRSWFLMPENDEEYAFGEDGGDVFPLDNLNKMNIQPQIAERGNDYYIDNRVLYISLCGTTGKAIVEGSEFYEVDFEYTDGEISNLVCSCFCSGACKHEFAAMLQLRECLDVIEKEYGDKYTDYFAAISKGVFVNTLLASKRTGKINIDF